MTGISLKHLTTYTVLLLYSVLVDVKGVEYITVDVCSDPYPPMPQILHNATHTNGNGLTCYECEVENSTEISDNTCQAVNCTGNGPEGSYPSCYRWEFTYRGIEQNLIRAGCAVNCSHINYKQYMCSGVGEKVFDKCDFTMCRGDKCNTATLLTHNRVILPLASFLLLVYS